MCVCVCVTYLVSLQQTHCIAFFEVLSASIIRAFNVLHMLFCYLIIIKHVGDWRKL